MNIIRKSSLPQLNSYSFKDAFNELKNEQIYHSNQDYKLSKYNISYTQDKCIVVYNLASDAIVIFEKEEILDLLENSELNLCVTEEVFRCLVDQGILVPQSIDEDLRLAIVRQNQIINPDNEFKIAINTTYGCNARCSYCFEHNADHSKMAYDTADMVADYICKSIDETTLVTYRWFGGEPLLAADIIDRIISRVNCYFEGKLEYRSVILSNGTVYDDEIIMKMLNEWHVYEFHVTIDGERDVHNKKKSFIQADLDGYSRVMELIPQLLENNIIVACRVNIDKFNISTLENIVSSFDDYEKKDLLNIYAAPVRRHTKESEEYCFDYSEYNGVYEQIYSVLYKHGLLTNIESIMPKRKVTCCSTRATNEIVVDTRGKLFKCMQTSTSDQYSVGTVTNGLEYNTELGKWLMPQIPNECEGCVYMPICQAGCKGFRSLNNPFVSPCVNERYYLDVILKYVYLLRGKK